MPLVSVLGANGVQGTTQIRQLLKAGYAVRAISRHRSETLSQFESVDFRAADLFVETSLAPAFEGSDYVFANHPVYARRERPQVLASVGRAAMSADIKRVVWNTASWIPDRPGDPFTYGDNTKAINALWRTGVPATVFGSVLLMDNLLTGFAKPHIVNEGRYVYPHSLDLRCNWISLDDVARIMIAALDRPDLEGAWMNIGGPERLGPLDVASALSEALGKEIRFEPCSFEAFGETLAKALGDAVTPERRTAFIKDIADFYRYNNTAPTKPFEVDAEYMLRRIPIELETMRAWAKRQDWAAPPTGT